MSMVNNETVLLRMKLREANDIVNKFKSGAIAEKETRMQNDIDDAVSCRNDVKLLTSQLKKKLNRLASNVKIYRADKYVVLRK